MIVRSSLNTDELWKTVLSNYEGQIFYIGPRANKDLVSEFCTSFLYTDSFNIQRKFLIHKSFSYVPSLDEYRAFENKLVAFIKYMVPGCILIALVPFTKSLDFKQLLLSFNTFTSICCVYNTDVALITAVKL